MNYNTETVQIDARVINQAFLAKCDQGLVKEASENLSFFVRDRLRETGFARRVFTPTPVSSVELDRTLDSDEPILFLEKEPDSEAAAMTFRSTPDIRYYKGKRAAVNFEVLSTDEFKKSKFELQTYKVDITTILQQNSVKDLQKQEDLGMYNSLVAVATANNSVKNVGAAPTVPGVLKQAEILVGRQVPLGVILMTHSTYLRLLAEPATQVGSPLASALVTGEANLSNFYGWRIVTTIKNDVVPDGRVIYLADPDNFLGKMYVLQDATATVKTEGHMLTFNMYESIGMTIANIKGVHIADFTMA